MSGRQQTVNSARVKTDTPRVMRCTKVLKRQTKKVTVAATATSTAAMAIQVPKRSQMESTQTLALSVCVCDARCTCVCVSVVRRIARRLEKQQQLQLCVLYMARDATTRRRDERNTNRGLYNFVKYVSNSNIMK